MKGVEAGESLCDPVLISSGWAHGFGTRGSQVPEPTAFPQQVHGVAVVSGASWSGASPEADAVVTSAESPRVGIVTADCVPIFVASAARGRGAAAVAIHAGWRGFAGGVIEAGVEALRDRVGAGAELVAAIGPAARGCCYEVDAPVRDALAERYSDYLTLPFMTPRRPGHDGLDLPGIAGEVLLQLGLGRDQIGLTHRLCTICHPALFESYRRDGAAAGRLRHFIGDDDDEGS